MEFLWIVVFLFIIALVALGLIEKRLHDQVALLREIRDSLKSPLRSASDS
jgi:hypothetical protein